MNVLYLMIPMAFALGLGFVAAFFWATSHGQFDDLETPALRILDDNNERTEREPK
ncbi:MAG: cbb3-type cytochrome oxidase assembly protein CcoS [Bdellovibrionaceae bacterium]|nr:cbb3-type cytochrome oxidase assembly protein CcoS [Pseudobdellovibrionaceae bacterium]